MSARVAKLPTRVSLPGGVKTVGGGLADLLFPPSCASCDVELEESAAGRKNALLCDTCLELMEIFAGPMCGRCGAPVPPIRRDPEDGCYRCTGRRLWFDATVALGAYEGELREIVLRMKNADGDGLSLAMARLLVEERRPQLAEIRPDVVAPIPSHWRRRLVHRTNSAAVLAEVVAGSLRVPFAERLLRRSRHTLRQSDVSATERWKNIRRAFAVRGGYHLNDAHVLLVDDVLTTGATCSEAAKALRRAGTARVTVATIARAV